MRSCGCRAQKGSPEIASTLITAPTEVFKLRWSTIAPATRDLEEMREAVSHSMELELFPSGGVDAHQVHQRVHRDDFWRKNSEVLHLSEDMDVGRKWLQKRCECHSDECREAALKHSAFICPQNWKGMRGPFWRSRMSSANTVSLGEDLDGTVFCIHGAYGSLLAHVQQRVAFLSEARHPLVAQ